MADKKRVARPPPLVNSVIKIISKAIVVEPFLSPRMLVSLVLYALFAWRRIFSTFFPFLFFFLFFVDLVSVCDFVCFLSGGIIEKVTFTRRSGGSVSFERRRCDYFFPRRFVV